MIDGHRSELTFGRNSEDLFRDSVELELAVFES